MISKKNSVLITLLKVNGPYTLLRFKGVLSTSFLNCLDISLYLFKVVTTL